jgi:hypothetical protein
VRNDSNPTHNMLHRLFAIILICAPFGLAFVTSFNAIPHHGKAAMTSFAMKDMFGSQPGKAALRYEKRAKEEAALKAKEAEEAKKKAEDEKAKAAGSAPKD